MIKSFKADLFDLFLLLFFVTLHADRLSYTVAGFTLRANNCIALIVCGLFICRFRHLLFVISKKTALSLLFMTCSVVTSCLLSSDPSRSLVFLGWWGLTLGVYFLFPYLLLKMGDVNKIVSLYFLSFILVGCYALLQLVLSIFGYSDPHTDQKIMNTIVRPNAFAYEPSYYCLYMTPFIFLCNYHYLIHPNTPFFLFKSLNTRSIIFVNLLYVISTSTAVFFAYLLFFILVLFASPHARKRVWSFLFCVILTGLSLVLTAPFLMRHFFLKFFYGGFMTHHSFFERWVGVVNAWNIFLAHPFFGIGLGAFPSYLMRAYLNHDTTFIFLNIHAASAEALYPLKHFEPMNVGTELLASLGLFGLFSLCILFFYLFQGYKKIERSAKETCLNFLLSVILMAFILQFNQGLLRTYIWLHLALTFALLDREEHDQVTPPLYCST